MQDFVPAILASRKNFNSWGLDAVQKGNHNSLDLKLCTDFESHTKLSTQGHRTHSCLVSALLVCETLNVVEKISISQEKKSSDAAEIKTLLASQNAPR